ncbi:MAG TPA: hypothetical protein VNT20_19675 [Flavisolibacter sp.]|nr:hypothetical protein [Flavisolibacter sp.]
MQTGISIQTSLLYYDHREAVQTNLYLKHYSKNGAGYSWYKAEERRPSGTAKLFAFAFISIR